ncbi:hypothetical protein AB0M46_24385 [Dactylosporangium sp. NPDC051485]|uniref:hypothetical protein n=1 Tax=Dactylosporangium sp. NPDC051485 TaxID=3154846 RepID=UPI00344A52C2
MNDPMSPLGALSFCEDTLFASRDERIVFGDLLSIDVDAAIDEAAWIPPTDPAPAGSGNLVTGLWEVTG